MLTKLSSISRRIDNPTPFFSRMLKDLRNILLESLRENTPGEKLWNEWAGTIKISKNKSELRIFNRRLEGDRGTWEIIFGWLNDGTRTHYIEPVNAEALRWIDKLGNVHFSKGHIVSGILPAFFAEQCERLIIDFEKTLDLKWGVWVETGRYI